MKTDITKMTLAEYKTLLKKKKESIVYSSRGWGVYSGMMGKEKDYGVIHLDSGMYIQSGMNSVNQAKEAIRNRIPDKIIAKEGGIDSFIREMFYFGRRTVIEDRKYGGRKKRFPKYGAQYVLDIGASVYPDIRATHAIDLRKPTKTFKNLKYKYGYDFNKESTNLPYPDNYFDIVVSYGALGRNFGCKNIFKEIYRVLKPGGRFEANWFSVAPLKKAGFVNLKRESYIDKLLNQKVVVQTAYKRIR